jgi:hypothetical protein
MALILIFAGAPFPDSVAQFANAGRISFFGMRLKRVGISSGLRRSGGPAKAALGKHSQKAQYARREAGRIEPWVNRKIVEEPQNIVKA